MLGTDVYAGQYYRQIYQFNRVSPILLALWYKVREGQQERTC